MVGSGRTSVGRTGAQEQASGTGHSRSNAGREGEREMSTVALFCRNCGKPLGGDEKAAASIYCSACATQFASAPVSPPAMAPVADPSASPGLAFLLGLIPGVGAIYNGQYAKGLIHAVIFGFLVSITSSGAAGGFEPLFGLMIAAWVFYMAFEAYHTAQKRLRGEAVDEFSSIFPMGT